jgi:hypothetical protein
MLRSALRLDLHFSGVVATKSQDFSAYSSRILLASIFDSTEDGPSFDAAGGLSCGI